MNYFKKIFINISGYWVHSKSSLPLGTDLYIDVVEKFEQKELPVIFDVGANVGQTNHYFRSLFPNSTIYCFEPVLDTFKMLGSNIKADNKNVLENIALGEEEGSVVIRLHKENTLINSLQTEMMSKADDAIEEKIQVQRLDEYCLRNNINQIDFLKIDTEGFEMPVLKGAGQMISNGCISFILAECDFNRTDRRHSYFPLLLEWLNERDYLFVGFYDQVLHGWTSNSHYGNALFAHKKLRNS